MPTNHHAAIRYHVIDKCLRNKEKTYQWKDLSEAVTDHFREYNKDIQPSRRTIMGDISAMRSGRLGYEAPIIYDLETGYRYAHPKFSIHHVNLSPTLLDDLSQSISLLHQLTHNEHLTKLSQSLVKISETLRIDLDPTRLPIIYFEHSLNEPGQKWLDTVYMHTQNKQTLLIDYQPFNQEARVHFLSPAFIKEYNNRWYIFGYDHDHDRITNLALDRIVSVKKSLKPYYLPEDFDHDTYFEGLFGVTKPEGTTPMTLLFDTTLALSAYMDTKPIHISQKRLTVSEDKVRYSLHVYDNYEIRSKLRSFGEDLVVVCNRTKT